MELAYGWGIVSFAILICLALGAPLVNSLLFGEVMWLAGATLDTATFGIENHFKDSLFRNSVIAWSRS